MGRVLAPHRKGGWQPGNVQTGSEWPSPELVSAKRPGACCG
jgi:hypothetical protein